MRIRTVETLRPAFQSNLCVVRLTTDDGLVGLGDAFFHASAVEAFVHDSAAPVLFAMTDPTPERVSARLTPYVGFQGGGVENRGRGAVDMALWDLLGRTAGMSVARLFGGPVRDSIRAYNTCAGTQYVGENSWQSSSNWGAGGPGRYEDLWAFMHEPGRLARELLDEGITAMKVWPFDEAAEKSSGNDISAADLARGLRVVSGIRDEVGAAVDVMVELHGLWNAPAAITIARALEEFAPAWIEDPVRVDAVDAMIRVKGATSIRIATGETATGRRGFLDLLQRNAIDVATVDVQWTGGLTEARKVAALADAYAIPIAPHDCTGPISLAASAQLVMSQPNGLIQETCRAFARSWYPDIVDGVLVIENGELQASNGHGLGVDLTEGFTSRADVSHRESSAGRS